jgi:hypothetical protein
MNTSDTSTRDQASVAAQALLEEIVALSYDADVAIEDLLDEESLPPMDEARARLFYTRILTILKTATTGATVDSDTIRDAVRAEVDELVAVVPRAAASRADLKLHGKFGMPVRDVLPSPVYNNIPVPLEEGYADADDLVLWSENPRVELALQEFAEVYDNAVPTSEDLAGLLRGTLSELPSLPGGDPHNLIPLARSIARKGISRPLVVTSDGVVLDGNRRLTASNLVRGRPREFSETDRDRARWIRVWKLQPDATEDQVEAVVVALNFEDEHKEQWPEYVKARKVFERVQHLRDQHGGPVSKSADKAILDEVARQFAILYRDVKRYVEMVDWAEDFSEYHLEAGRPPAEVRYRTDDTFQWFYEIQAGRGDAKLTKQIATDDTLRAITYDLMFDALTSGAQVRSLHKVLAMDDGYARLKEAHELAKADPEAAEELIDLAIVETKAAARARAKRRAGFDAFLEQVVERLGSAAPNDWAGLDLALVRDVLRVTRAATGTCEGVLSANGEPIE